MRVIIAILASSFFVLSSALFADANIRADSHGPIGVMGEHVHAEGEWMFSYRYMSMDMDGNRDGTERIGPSEITAPGGEYGYMVAPLDMTMDMHMVGAMYAPSDDLTLMLMVPFIDTEMDHVTRMGANFTTETDGLGDIKLSGLYRLKSTDSSTWILNIGVSLPTGSIDEEDVTPASMGNNVQLPYPMQLGSGTYDLLPGITYTNTQDTYSWGAQAKLTWRLGENDNGYTLGDRFMLTAWYAKPFAQHFSWSIRTAYEDWNNIDGIDEELNPMASMMVATADPDLRKGERLDLAIGINWIMPFETTNRLAVEFVRPVYQDLEGPQLETDSTIILGWQLSL